MNPRTTATLLFVFACLSCTTAVLSSSASTFFSSSSQLPKAKRSGAGLITNENSDKAGAQLLSQSFQRLRKAAADANSNETPKSCLIEIQVVKKVKGKCMTLMGGQPACEADSFMDPTTTDCD